MTVLLVLVILMIHCLVAWIIWIIIKRGNATPAEPVAREKRSAATAVNLSVGGGGFGFAIVGESHRQDTLRALSESLTDADRRADFFLIPDPTNKHDPNAVMVTTEELRPVGYLSREDAVAYRRALSKVLAGGKVGKCRGTLRGGTGEKRSIGVWLDLKSPRVLLEDDK